MPGAAEVTRRRLVRVPASSANLGPGFDCLAAALGMHLELEVVESGSFAVHTDLHVARGRENLCVRAFESLHPADRFEFHIRSDIPLSGGLGSSAAAIVAGLLAADHLFELDTDLLAAATAIEGHPDNVAAALNGGFVICASNGGPGRGGQGQDGHRHDMHSHSEGQGHDDHGGRDRQGGGHDCVRFDPPTGLEALAVVPHEAVRTHAARAALGKQVPLADAAFNVAHGCLLTLGLARSDWDLVARGLHDRLHQRQRSHLFPRSYELMQGARELGALGATISGAGPTVLVWCFYEQTGAVVQALQERIDGWATLIRAPFEPQGAHVHEM